MKGNGILADDGKAVIVALDHGLFTTNVPPLDAIAAATREVVAAGADGVLVTPGLMRRLGVVEANVVVRTDRAASITAWDGRTTVPFTTDMHAATALAVMAVTHHPAEADQLAHLAMLIDAAHRAHMPVMAEMLPGNYTRQEAFNHASLVGESGRIAAELGADVVKTRYVDDGGFQHAVAQVGLPVLILGGPDEGDARQTLSMVAAAMSEGASGVAMGRNIWGHPAPRLMVRALCEVVHHGLAPAEAARVLEGSR